MPRFDRGVVNTKLEKGDIVLMGNPTQYGEILAENILVEDILKADLETLISGSNLVRGKFYRITNAVSGTLSLLVQGLTANTICDYAYNTANGDLVTYNISTDLAGVPFSSVYVPYTGATADVNLGEYQIRVGQLELDQTPTGTFGVGKIRWNDTDGTPEVMLKGANVTLQIGQEQLARVVNKTNTNLTEAGYQVVRISGAQGQRLKVGLAQANSTSTCKDTLGLVTENISNNAEGFITTSGLVRGINTTGSLQSETWADGDRIYLSPSVAGGITNIEPSAPNIVIVLGYVVYAHATQGSIYVSVEGAKALHELFDVSIPTPTNNNVLVYESSTGLWKDKSISTILGYTPIANNATVGGELSGTLPNPSLVTSAVTGKALTGLSVSGSAVVSTDSILTGIGKLQNQINAVMGSVNFQGTWNASTNTPTLASGVGTKGYYYIVTVAGSTNLDGITDWKLGDWVIFDGTTWQKVDNTDAVVSVNGYTGIVTLAAADVGALPTSAISGTTGKLAKFTSSGAVGDSIVSESGGNIGINATPSIFAGYSSIAINGVSGGIFETQVNGTSAMLLFSNSGGSIINERRNLPISFLTNGLTRLSIENDGQIITQGASDTGEAHIFGGSARVNGNLGVVGNIVNNYTISGSTFGLDSIGLTKIANGLLFRLGAISGVTNGFTSQLNTSNDGVIYSFDYGNVGIGTTSPTAKFHLVTTTGAYGAALAKFEDGWSVSSLKFTNPVGTFALQAYAQDNPSYYLPLVLNNQGGNVLIGTTTDDGLGKLQVNGITKINGDILIKGIYNPYTSTNRGTIMLNGTTDNIIAFSNNSSAKGYLFHDGTDLEVLNATTTGKLKFYTNSNLAFRISSTGISDFIGSVGIGTDNPLSTLHVNGTIRTVLTSGVGGQSLLGAINGVSNGYVINVDASNNITHTWHTGANNPSMHINATGSVGIGTVSPSSYSFNDPAFLVVANTSGNSTLSIVSSTTGIGYLAFADGTTGTDRYSGSIFYSHSTDTMSFKTAGSDRLEISSTGAATFSSSIAIGNTVTTAVAIASTHKVEMVIGGVTYYLLATT